MSKFIKSIKFTTKSSNFIHHKKLPEELSLHDDDFDVDSEEFAEGDFEDDATRNLQPKDGKSKNTNKFQVKFLGSAALPLPLSFTHAATNCKANKSASNISDTNNTSLNAIKYLIKAKKPAKSTAGNKSIIRLTPKGVLIRRATKQQPPSSPPPVDGDDAPDAHVECHEDDISISIYSVSNCGLHTLGGRTYFTFIALHDDATAKLDEDIAYSDETPKEKCYVFECTGKKQAKRIACTIGEVFAQAEHTQQCRPHDATRASIAPAAAVHQEARIEQPAAGAADAEELIRFDDVLCSVTKKWVSFDEISQTSITNLILI